MLVKSSFSFLYISLLIIVMAISSFAQYYFGMTYRLLLCADQLVFVQFLSQILCLVLNLVASVALIKLGASLHFVKLITSSIYLLQPIVFASIAKRRYVINKKIEYNEEPIKQKWNGIAQHIASVVVNNTDTVILSVFSTLTNVSIYSVYNMVVAGIKQFVLSISNGMQAMLGNMLANNEKNNLIKSFDYIEWLVHSFVAFFWFCSFFLLRSACNISLLVKNVVNKCFGIHLFNANTFGIGFYLF